MQNDPVFDDFCDYLTRVWSNQNVSVHGELVRTNNSVESFHKYLFDQIGRSHPNVWIFLNKLKAVEHAKAVQLNRVRNGFEQPEERRRKYRLGENVIRQAEQVLSSNHDVERFLRVVSHQSSRLIQMLATVPGNLIKI